MDDIEQNNSKPFWKRQLFRKNFIFVYTGLLFILVALKPHDWNTVYFSVEPKAYTKHVFDSLQAHRSYPYPIVAHTFFEFNKSNAYKKYKHGDTVPIFYKDKLVGEMTSGERKMIWSKIDEIVPDTLSK